MSCESGDLSEWFAGFWMRNYIPTRSRFHSWIDYLNSESVCRFCKLYPVSNCIQMIGEFLSIRWDGKYSNWSNLYLEHSPQSRKLSRQKFHNELVYVFTASCASKNADWNQQQLKDGGILANRNSADHPYCFLSNQKQVQIRPLLHMICERIVSCPPPENRLHRYRERARSQASRGGKTIEMWWWKQRNEQ